MLRRSIEPTGAGENPGKLPKGARRLLWSAAKYIRDQLNSFSWSCGVRFGCLTRETYFAVRQRHAPLLPSSWIARLTQELWNAPGELRPIRTPIVVNQQRFFLRLGERIREMRRKHRHSQEDMISYGFSARHWQQIEAGRPITVSTLLRICAVFETSAERLIHGLDTGIYEN